MFNDNASDLDRQKKLEELIRKVELLNLSSSSVFAVDIKAEGKPFATKNLEKISVFILN